jgi:AAA+ ATPase superfamily predicted ATPase
VGRAAELAALERQHRREGAVLLPVYGRRRVGKSELIVHFCEGRPAVYFAATQGTAVQQLRSFMQSAAEALGNTLLGQIDPGTWERALELVMQAFPKGERQILVLDEFQWLCESSPELPSVLQKLWDHRWQHEQRPYLVLCGSYIGFMEREVLGSRSPLFGRRTGQLLIEPFSYLESREFHPRWSLEDQARAWFICGGVPAYLKAFWEGQSLEQNIVLNFLDVDGALLREAEFLLREELRDVGSYTTVIEAIANGQHTPTAISKLSGLPVPKLMYFLGNLARLGYVEKRLPLVPGKPSAKLVRYDLSDPLLRFWYRFVSPHFSAIRRGPPHEAFQHHVRPHLESFFGAGFEALCRAALPYLLDAEKVKAASRVGEFWSAQAQIDVVALREDRWTELGECKWGEPASLSQVVAELRGKVAHYPLSGATPQLRVFTRKSFSAKPPPGVKVHSLRSLYEVGGRV